jgi:hypothetical protein
VTLERLAPFFTLFRRHAFPTIAYFLTGIAAMTSVAAQTSEENPAEG